MQEALLAERRLLLQSPAALAAAVVLVAVAVAVAAYLVRLNQLLRGTPDEVARLTPTRWTEDLLRETYRRLEADPITTSSYARRIPPKLERRYIITGGSGEFARPWAFLFYLPIRPTPTDTARQVW